MGNLIPYFSGEQLPIFAILLAVVVLTSESTENFPDETHLEEFLKYKYEKAASIKCNKQVVAEWNFVTDINNQTKKDALLNVTLESAKFDKYYWAKYFLDLDPDDYKNEITQRQVEKCIILGRAALSAGKLKQLTNISSTMTNIYSTAKICPFKNQKCKLAKEGLSLTPDIESVMAVSNDYAELQYVWEKWRDASGAKIKKHFNTYIQLSNDVAKLNHFKNQGEMWISDYETSMFVENMDNLWQQVKPLYTQLHRYVRKKLQERYGNKTDLSDELIPAHVLGNMWGQSWTNLYSLVIPFPKATEMNITAALKEQKYTVLKMFKTADEFYKSLGLLPNDICYNVAKGAMIEKPVDREVSCDASAWDFCDGENYRVKMCAKVDYEDFIMIHQKMGNIQYFLQYRKQPITLRNAANPGFRAAVGDAIALSVTTPKHLKELGLLKNYKDDEEVSINALMHIALDKVAFLPFGLLLDKWRWDVFAGKVSPEEWNSHWWYYRKVIQKVKAPLKRSNKNDFDPGAKYHVASGTPYINYFVAHILEFQLYRGLCKEAKQYEPENCSKPLHTCDFYKSKAAGKKLKDGLSLGSSKHWKAALEKMTGETDLDASAILDYFKPLYVYLKEENGKVADEKLKNFLKNQYEPEISQIINERVTASFNFATDINNATKKEKKVDAIMKYAEVSKLYWNKHFRDLQVNDYNNEILRRQITFLKVLGNAALETEHLLHLTEIQNDMENIYGTAKICPYTKQQCILTSEGLSLETDLVNILASSTNYDELTYVWNAWRLVIGAKIKMRYQPYVFLANEAAVANGFKDNGDMWRERYESPKFVEKMDNLWEQIKPLYDQMHQYVRRKLKERYGDKLNIEDGLIPAHVLGNMWAQSWINLSPLVKPYPNASSVDITAALKENNYTVLRMFQTSDKFYQSLGLKPNDMSYNVSNGAVIEKPDDREIECHPSAWDFSNKKDFRIKMCAKVNYEDFITIHREMGHIQYYLQYKDQPVSFRRGANPGFHDAVGGTIALSVATPQYLAKIGLVKDYKDSDEATINSLMDMALERVAFLPFALLMDKWRWDVFALKVYPEKWNSLWWKYRETIQKVKAPVPRSDLDDFDPGANYHVPADSQYIKYFVGHILEFQLYRELCIASGQYNPKTEKVPLHRCDFYQSKKVGTRLSAGLSLGASQHWNYVLEVMIGKRELDAAAMLEYFDPLFRYLQEQNKMSEEELEEFLKKYEIAESEILYELATAKWNYVTDVNNKTKQEEQLNVTLKVAEFNKRYWKEYFRYLKQEDYKSESLQRQVKSLKLLGRAALDSEKLTELTNVGNYMTNIYSNARICPYYTQKCNLETEGLELDPSITNILVKSRDYDELTYVWKAWRDATGAKMKKKYESYVDLSNEAATANGFHDTGYMWINKYESPTFIQDMDTIWEKVKPLYTELHRFVLNKLKGLYKGKLDVADGLIPAHVFGNMWAQSWTNLATLVKPYPKQSSVNITAALQNHGYTVLKMFETANEFYTSLGLESNSVCYNTTLGAVIEKPKDRKILCHAAAWDFKDKKNFRIKMCAEVNYDSFYAIHHEMGHIQYFILYKNQPITFREGANPGFHEAVGDTINLAVTTPKHLQTIGLLTNYADSNKAALNSLMDTALEKVAFLPYALIMDKWRWDVFAGKIPKDKWNSHWWHYRKTFQKIKPPVERSDKYDFDPGAKFHVPGGAQYINYFVAHILQFQLYRGLCIVAGEYNPENTSLPLHKCDFYKSILAGDRLRKGLSLGASKHWKDALEAITGERELDASALLEYFQPLLEYLRTQNSKKIKSNAVSAGSSKLVVVLLVANLKFYV